jgi:hypothetical protein
MTTGEDREDDHGFSPDALPAMRGTAEHVDERFQDKTPFHDS